MLKLQARREELLSFDRRYYSLGMIAGVDEVGRGPLAGPVTVCACILPHECELTGIDDSKKLTEKRRELLYEKIREAALDCRVVFVEKSRIDEINILEATREAMTEAVNSLRIRPDIVLCDAMTLPGVPCAQENIVSGDAASYSIAAASILAKVERDRYMTELAKQYPQYHWEKNKGYGTREHMDAIRRYGLTPHHRRSFCKRFL